jgi:hypothetical protein
MVRPLREAVSTKAGGYVSPSSRVNNKDAQWLIGDIHRTVFVYGHDTLVPTYMLVHQSRASLQAETPGVYITVYFHYNSIACNVLAL